MARIRAFIENIIYYNEDNFYAVLDVSCEGDLFTAVGYFPCISPGETIDAEGSYTTHPVYGEQFAVETFTVVTPEDQGMAEKYLAGGAIKGVGPALAKRIVKKFKADTFRILEEEPERLCEVRGISEPMARAIGEQVSMKKSYRDAVLYMQNFGLGPNMAQKIYNHYGPALYNVIEKDPYRLADEVEGIGFKLADTIAGHLGIEKDSPFRIRSGVIYVLRDGVGQGHTWLPAERLCLETAQLLSVAPEAVREVLGDLQIEGKIKIIPRQGDFEVSDFAEGRDPWEEFGGSDDRQRNAGSRQQSLQDDQVYLAACYYVERDIALRLNALDIRETCSEETVKSRIADVMDESGMEPDENQAEAIRSAVTSGVMIITGGPGTGKTTTINSIIRYFDKEQFEIMLAAPTGRAARRMTEATGREAKTIHRLLEYTGAPSDTDPKGRFESYGGSGNAGGAGSTDGKGHFLRDEKNPLECDVLIIDEMSMVDIFLMEALLKAIAPGTRLILSGDADQLPSVGAGNVLKDIIRSGRFPTVSLTRIFRQAAQSDIVVNAHKINAGEPVDLSKKSRDFLFIKGNDPASITGMVETLITEKLPGYVNAEPFDIQVLTPTRKGALGVESLNRTLQEFLNPPSKKKKEKETPEGTLREGDKVMQIKNDYDLEWERRDKRGLPCETGSGVFNGDMGKIVTIDEHAGKVTVLTDDDRYIEYTPKNLKELELAYAVTVHKSQGSEYPAVVMPMYYGPSMLMNRNLLYTGVTRAKKCVVLVGVPGVFVKMEANADENLRYSGLLDRIRELDEGL